MVDNVSQIQKSGDMYIMDGQSFDMETLMMTLQVQRTNTIEAQMVDQAEAIKKTNDELKELADALAELRRNRPEKADSDAGSVDANTQKILDKYKIDIGGGKQSDFDAAIDQIKAGQDSRNSQSQLDMIRLQSCQNKLNQAYEMMTNFVSKFAKTKDTIIGNMR